MPRKQSTAPVIPPELFVICRYYAFAAGAVTHLSGSKFYLSRAECQAVIDRDYGSNYYPEAIYLRADEWQPNSPPIGTRSKPRN